MGWQLRGVRVLAACAVLAIAPPAAAQADGPARDLLAQGIAAYEDGRFEVAAALLDRATMAAGLDRADVVRLLSHQVLVAQANGDEAALDRALVQLVTLDNDGLGASASPRLQQRTEAARERTGGATLGLDIEHRQTDAGLLVRARVRGDAGGLVRAVSIRVREGGGAWADGERGEVVLARADAVDVEVIAVATGPGGAALVTVGSEAAPHRLARPAPTAATAADPTTGGEGSDDGGWIGLGVGLGVAVVAAAVVLGIVLGTQGPGNSALTGPVVEW